MALNGRKQDNHTLLNFYANCLPKSCAVQVSEYSTMGGSFDSSKGELRRCNVSAGIGGRSYLAFQKIPKATADFCDWLNGELASVDRNDMAACYRLSF